MAGTMAMQKTPESAGKIKEPVKEKGRSGFWTLYLKELADHLEGNRLLIIMLMLFVVMLVSLSGTAKEIRESGVTNSQYMFLALITTNSTVYSFASFLAFLGPLAGIVLGFDAINNEQNIGTLNRLASQPIYRDAIINAKFLAGATVILISHRITTLKNADQILVLDRGRITERGTHEELRQAGGLYQQICSIQEAAE